MKKFNEEMLGQDVVIKQLSVGDMFKLENILLKDDIDEAEQMFTIVSLALVEPKLTVQEVYDLDFKYINDLTKIVELATTQED